MLFQNQLIPEYFEKGKNSKPNRKFAAGFGTFK